MPDTMWNLDPTQQQVEGEVLGKIKRDIEASNRYFEQEIQPMILQRQKLYHADREYFLQKYPELTEISEVISTDLSDLVEWSMPALIKAYFSSNDIVSIRAACTTDPNLAKQQDVRAKAMQALMNYQLTKLNYPPFFVVCYDWIKTAFIENAACIKCTWERETGRDQTIVDIFAPDELQALQNNPNIQVISFAPIENAQDLFRVEYATMRLLKNQPKIVNVPASEIRFSPEANDLGPECNFVAHRKIVTVDYLRKMERDGVYSNVDAVVDRLGYVQFTQAEILNNRDVDAYARNETQTARKKVELYECYVKLDLNNDQILEDWIITVANSVIIRQEINTLGRHPFFLLTPVRDPNRIWPKRGIGQFVCEIQLLKTGFLKQMVNNVALNNDLPAFIDEQRVNVMDVIKKKKTIRVAGSPRDAVTFPPLQPMAPWTMQFLQYLEDLKEKSTGVSSYETGMNSESLNKTATGISIIHESSNQRLELTARLILEAVLTPLFKYIVSLNQRFIDQEQVIRLENQPILITPDDLQGNFELEISSSLGVASKTQELQNIQLLLGLYPSLIQIGVANPQNIFNVVKKMLETMGYNNFMDYISPPPPPQPPQPQQKPPAVSINWKDLPPDGQVQAAAEAGLHIDPQGVMAQKFLEEMRKHGQGNKAAPPSRVPSIPRS